MDAYELRNLAIKGVKEAVQQFGVNALTIDLADHAVDFVEDHILEQDIEHDLSTEDRDMIYDAAFLWLTERDIGRPE